MTNKQLLFSEYFFGLFSRHIPLSLLENTEAVAILLLDASPILASAESDKDLGVKNDWMPQGTRAAATHRCKLKCRFCFNVPACRCRQQLCVKANLSLRGNKEAEVHWTLPWTQCDSLFIYLFFFFRLFLLHIKMQGEKRSANRIGWCIFHNQRQCLLD